MPSYKYLNTATWQLNNRRQVKRKGALLSSVPGLDVCLIIYQWSSSIPKLGTRAARSPCILVKVGSSCRRRPWTQPIAFVKQHDNMPLLHKPCWAIDAIAVRATNDETRVALFAFSMMFQCCRAETTVPNRHTRPKVPMTSKRKPPKTTTPGL